MRVEGQHRTDTPDNTYRTDKTHKTNKTETMAEYLVTVWGLRVTSKSR